MFKIVASLSMTILLSSCWPGPSYKGLDPRCEEWDKTIYHFYHNPDDEREQILKLNTHDKYHYYICVNVMNSWNFKDNKLFLNDSEQFILFAQSLLQGKMDETHLYLLSRICLDISRAKPGLVRENKSLIDALEAAANKVKSDFWRNWSLENVHGIRKVIGQ